MVKQDPVMRDGTTLPKWEKTVELLEKLLPTISATQPWPPEASSEDGRATDITEQAVQEDRTKYR